MLRVTTRRSYVSPASAELTWRYLSDPVAVAEAATHGKVVAPFGELRQGTEWDELHLEDGCDFEVVRWRCTHLVPHRSITVEGLQTGVRQRVTTELVGGPDRPRVVATLRITPSLRAPASPFERVLVLLVLLVPPGRRQLAELLDESVADDERALAALA